MRSAGTPSAATARLSPKWSGSTSRPASIGGFLNGLPSRGGLRRSEQAGQPPIASRPTRRNAPGPLPPSQMSSGFGGSGPMLAFSTVKNSLVEGHAVLPQQQPQQRQRLIEHRAAPSRRHREHGQFAGPGGAQAETGRIRPGASPASDASCLATSTGMPPRQHRQARADLQPGRPGRGIRHPDEGLNERAEHHLGQPQASSTPMPSSRSTASAKPPGRHRRPAQYPIRIFIRLSDHVTAATGTGSHPGNAGRAPPSGARGGPGSGATGRWVAMGWS